MTRHLRYFLLGLCLLLPLHAQPLTLEVTAAGVVARAGAFGTLTLPPPVLVVDGQKELKPVLALDDTGVARVTYANGFELTLAATGNSLTCGFASPPPSPASLKFSTLLPLSLNQGGRFSLDGRTGDFPATPAGQFLAHGDASRLDLVHPLGETLGIATPGAYQQLQDNRTWNWNVFAWIYRYDFHRYSGRRSFSFTFTLTAPPAGLASPRKFLVDRYGQSARKDWPGKIRTDAELQAAPASPPSSPAPAQAPLLDRFGGLSGSGATLGLQATGFFHTAVIAGNRHLLVTPEGNAFFQLGVCGIANTDDFTTVKGRENTYEWLPAPRDPAWKTAWRENRPDQGVFSFQIANWIRKYGKPYSFDEWTAQAVDRLRSWGFNSAGAFGPFTPAMRARNFPAVDFLPGGQRDGLVMLPDKIGAAEVMDPFAPGAALALDRAYAGPVAARANDPLLIGYFLGNEQHFENIPRLVPGYRASRVPAKARLVELLRSRYAGIAAFNAAWSPARPFASFEEAGEAPLFIRTDAAAADMRAYLQLYLDSYYGLIRRTFDRYDPNHLLLGSRWTPGTAASEDIVRIGGKYLDVISVNYYTYSIETDFLQKIHDWSGGRPLLLSEWYYSSTDRGLGAGKEVAGQTARGLGYRNYVEQSAATGLVVGSQWFIYSDQALTGRFFEGFNGEGNNTGLVDVTDQPYEPLVSAARLTHSRIYDVLLGREKPFAFDDPRFSGKPGDAAKTVAIPQSLPGLQLNGSTTGWPGRPAEPIPAARIVIGNPDPALGGDFRLCWDSQALHFLIQVKDPTPAKNNKLPRDLWSGDAVELFVGHRNLAEKGPLQFSDRQFLLGAGAAPSVFVTDHPDAGAQCRVLVVKNVTGDGYTLQADIPWIVLGLRPEAGMELLFDVAIDYSEDGDTRTRQLVWNGTARNSGDRGAWGRARLVDN